MTAITFPTDPANGELYTAPNGCVYIWDGEKWVVNSTIYTGPALADISQDRVAPMFVNGVNTGITFTYNATTNVMTSTVTGGGSGDSLVNGDSSFSVSSDGTLTLTHPPESDPIVHPLSTTLTIQKAAGNYHTISGAYGLSLQATPVPSGYGLNTNTNFVDIFHDGISVNVNDNTWGFGTDGTLTLPASGTVFSGDSLSGVKLSFTDTEFTDGKYITVRAGGDNYNHLHIDSGDNSKFDLFLGDDNKYVKVNHNGDINVVATGNADILGSTNTNIHTTAGDVNIYTADHNGYSSGFPVAGVLLQNPVIVQTTGYGTVWDSVPWAVPGARLRFWGLDQNTGHALPVEPTELNDFFYVGHDGTNDSNFALYHDEALTQPVDGTGWTGPYNGHDYGILSGGWIGLPEIAGNVNIGAGSTHSWGVPGKVNITTHYKDASNTQHAVTWAFGADGGLTFPDDTVQTTAYTGGGSTSYTPDDSDNWNEPTINTISAALDELAARVTAFENFEIDGGNAYTPAVGELLIDGYGA